MWIGIALWLAGIVFSPWLWLAGIGLRPWRIDITPFVWAVVGIPLLWGVWITVDKALVLFQ